MNTGRTLTTKHSFFITLLVAAILALSAGFGSIAVDQVTGTQFTPFANACAGQGSGC